MIPNRIYTKWIHKKATLRGNRINTYVYDEVIDEAMRKPNIFINLKAKIEENLKKLFSFGIKLNIC